MTEKALYLKVKVKHYLYKGKFIALKSIFRNQERLRTRKPMIQLKKLE